MNVKLRTLVRRIVNEALDSSKKGAVVNFENYSGVDLDASCNQCSQPLWLVWEQGKAANHWTECGGIGEGSCPHRGGREDGDTRGCVVCDKTDVTLDADDTCKMCERMLVRIKMMDGALDDAEAVAYARSLRVNKK